MPKTVRLGFWPLSRAHSSGITARVIRSWLHIPSWTTPPCLPMIRVCGACWTGRTCPVHFRSHPFLKGAGLLCHASMFRRGGRRAICCVLTRRTPFQVERCHPILLPRRGRRTCYARRENSASEPCLVEQRLERLRRGDVTVVNESIVPAPCLQQTYSNLLGVSNLKIHRHLMASFHARALLQRACSGMRLGHTLRRCTRTPGETIVGTIGKRTSAYREPTAG